MNDPRQKAKAYMVDWMHMTDFKVVADAPCSCISEDPVVGYREHCHPTLSHIHISEDGRDNYAVFACPHNTKWHEPLPTVQAVLADLLRGGMASQ